MTSYRNSPYWQWRAQKDHERRLGTGHDAPSREDEQAMGDLSPRTRSADGNPFAPLIVLAMIVIVLMAVLSDSGSGVGGGLRALGRLL